MNGKINHLRQLKDRPLFMHYPPTVFSMNISGNITYEAYKHRPTVVLMVRDRIRATLKYGKR